MNQRVVGTTALLSAVPSVALAHGQELVLYWLASDVVLIAVTALFLIFWREKFRTKLTLLAILVIVAAATNAVPFLPGSLSLMSDFGAVGLFALFTMVPLGVAGVTYAAMRCIWSRAATKNAARSSASTDSFRPSGSTRS